MTGVLVTTNRGCSNIQHRCFSHRSRKLLWLTVSTQVYHGNPSPHTGPLWPSFWDSWLMTWHQLGATFHEALPLSHFGESSTIVSLKEKITVHLHANHPSLASSHRFKGLFSFSRPRQPRSSAHKAASLAVTNTGKATPFSPPLGATTSTIISTAQIPPASAPVSAQ